MNAARSSTADSGSGAGCSNRHQVLGDQMLAGATRGVSLVHGHPPSCSAIYWAPVRPIRDAGATYWLLSKQEAYREPQAFRNASSSAVVVPNVLTCCSRPLVRPGTRTHATTCGRPGRSSARSPAPWRHLPGEVAPTGASCLRLCSTCSMATTGVPEAPRQFWLGLVVPNSIDVPGRRRAGDDS